MITNDGKQLEPDALVLTQPVNLVLPRQAFVGLQVGRGFAALIVLLFHNSLIFESEKYWNNGFYNGIFGFGHSGVEFFFVLSGFIICYAHRKDIGRSSQAAQYALKRLIRVFPIYWIMTTILFFAMIASGNAQNNLLISSYLLLGFENNAIIPVAWTLFHEVLFYLLFAILIYNKIFGSIALGTWFFTCFLRLDMPPLHYIFDPINLLFGLGMTAFFISECEKKIFGGVTLGVALFFAVAIEDMYIKTLSSTSLSFCYGIASVFFVLGAISSERLGNFRALPGLPLLGDASYSLYLIHYPLLSLLAKIFMAVSVLRALPHFISFGLLTLLCIAAALACNLWVEKPILRYLGNKFSPSRASN